MISEVTVKNLDVTTTAGTKFYKDVSYKCYRIYTPCIMSRSRLGPGNKSLENEVGRSILTY